MQKGSGKARQPRGSIATAFTLGALQRAHSSNQSDKGNSMYARKLRIELRPNSAIEFRQLLTERVIPLLRRQKGFQDQITLSTSWRNEAIAISFWDNEENADAYNHVAYLDVLRAV